MSDKYERLLDILQLTGDWVTAAELADRLGVTTRSVRSYVAAAKAAAQPTSIISASTLGYRLNREAYAQFTSGARPTDSDSNTPQARVHYLVRRLTEAPAGLDIHTLADSLHVSESTIESDLRKVRAMGEDVGLALSRRGSVVCLTGSERDYRRLLSTLFRSETTAGFLGLGTVQDEFASDNLAAFKTDLIAMLDSQGYFVNEYGIDSVLLHVAIAVDRVGRNRRLPGRQDARGSANPTADTLGASIPNADTVGASIPNADALGASIPNADALGAGSTDADTGGADIRNVENTAGVESRMIPDALAELIRLHFEVTLDPTDIEYLAKLLNTRVMAPGLGEPVDAVAAKHIAPDDLDTVRRIVAHVGEEYLVDLSDETFMVRLALHLGNLVTRAKDSSYSRNPLMRSIKTSYPMIYDVAVFIASQIQRERSIVVNDDEISYIALHLGSHLERESRRGERITCAIVCPGYYDMHVILRERVEQALGSELSVEIVVTRTDVDWSDFSTDLVLTTIEARGIGDTIVVIQPFLTDGDIENIRKAITRAHRHKRRMQIKDDLLMYFDEGLFLRNAAADDEPAMIRLLGALMTERGIIDQSYVDGAIERELMSSTAFTDTIAVPHAMVMTATRTSIAIAVNETPMPWGDSRVNMVALIAFSASGRASFQIVFDQFVDVFADRTEVLALVRRSVTFSTFIEGLVQLIDK